MGKKSLPWGTGHCCPPVPAQRASFALGCQSPPSGPMIPAQGIAAGAAVWLPWLGSSASCPTMPDHPLTGVYRGSLPHSHVDNGACVWERFLSSPDLCTSHGRPHPCSEPPRGSPGWPRCPRTPLARAAQSPWAPLPSGGPQPLPRPSPSSSFQSRRNAASWRRLPTEDGTPPHFCPSQGDHQSLGWSFPSLTRL